MQVKSYEAALRRMEEATKVLFGVLLREPHLALVCSHKFKRAWFDYAPASISKAVKCFFAQIDATNQFSMYAAPVAKISADAWLRLMADAGDVTFDAAVIEAADAAEALAEQLIALNVVGEWSHFEPREIRRLSDELRARVRLDVVDNISDGFDDWFEQKLQNGEPSYPCWMTIDQLKPYIRFFEPGSMTVIAARPSVGKTFFLLNLMKEWLQAGLRGFMISLDMSTTMLKARALGMLSGINPRADWSLLTPDDAALLRSCKSELSSFDLEVIDGVADIDLLERLIQAEHAKSPLHFIAVDHLQLMSARGAQTRYQMITDVSGRLKVLAKSLGVPAIVVSQLNRAAEARSNTVPRLSDLRESGAIEQDATYVIALHRESGDANDRFGDSSVIVLKNQNGPTSGLIQMNFHPVFGWMCASQTQGLSVDGSKFMDNAVPF